MILESFHKDGTNPEDKDLLNIDVTGFCKFISKHF